LSHDSYFVQKVLTLSVIISLYYFVYYCTLHVMLTAIRRKTCAIYIARCNCYRVVSVRLFVTNRYCVKTAEPFELVLGTETILLLPHCVIKEFDVCKISKGKLWTCSRLSFAIYIYHDRRASDCRQRPASINYILSTTICPVTAEHRKYWGRVRKHVLGLGGCGKGWRPPAARIWG